MSDNLIQIPLHFSSTQCCCQCKCKDLDPTFLCFRTCASELKFQRQPDQNFRKYLGVAATIFILLSAIQVGIEVWTGVDNGEPGIAHYNKFFKPLKFTISGGIYILTVGFLTTLYPFSRRKKNILNNFLHTEGCSRAASLGENHAKSENECR